MLNIISFVVIFIALSVPLQSFAQDADSVNSTPPGISPEEVNVQIETLSNELNSEFSTFKDSLKMRHKSEIDSLTKSMASKHLVILDSLRNAITKELTDNFEKEKNAITKELTDNFEKEMDAYTNSINAKMSSSRSSDSETAKNYFEFIKILVESRDKELFDDAIIEMDNFTKLYWSGKLSEDVQLMLVETYEKKKMQFETLVSYIKFIHLYPSSQKGDQVRADLVSFISGKVNKSISSKKSDITRIVDIPQQEKAYQDKYFAYIQTIYNLQITKLDNWTLNEIKYFSSILPDDERQPQIAYWYAKLHQRLGNKKESSSFASKVILGYPDSPLVPDAYYLKATIQNQKLGKHKDAASNFLIVVDKFPTHILAVRALYDAGTIQTKKLKDHSESVRSFKRIIDEYPNDTLAVDALLYGAKVLTDKVKDYNEARRFYHLITTKYPNDPRGGKALKLAGKVAESKQKDYDAAVKDYIAVHEKYPNDLKAIELLIKAAQLQEKKKKDLNGSVSTLQIIVSKYPSYKDIGKIQKRIDKLKEKIFKG